MGFCSLHIGGGSFKCGLIRYLVYDEKGLSASHAFAFRYGDFYYFPRYLRVNFNILLTLDGSRIIISVFNR